MKNIIIAITCFMAFSTYYGKAQTESPQLLKEPASWQFERFKLPPVFSPDFPYKGVEELRFAPGMFNKESSDYFSYAFVAQLDDINSFTQSDLKNYLLKYFQGLCESTAKQRKLSIDTSKIAVLIKEKSKEKNITVYDAVLNVFGVFVDGASIALNAEIRVEKDTPNKKTYIVFIASPKERTDKIWQQLHTIQNDFTIPNN